MTRIRARTLATGIAGIAVFAILMVADVAMVENPLGFALMCLVSAAALAGAHQRSMAIALIAAIASLGCTAFFALTGGTPALSFSEMFALLVLLGQCCRDANGTRDVIFTVLVAAAVLALPLRSPMAYPSWYVLNGLLALAALAIGSALHNFDQRRIRAVELTRTEERERISRELHDVVAHHVTGVLVTARAARLEDDPARVAEALQAIELASAEALAATRELVTTLREDPAAGQTPSVTMQDVKTLVERFRASGSSARVNAVLPEKLSDPLITMTVHRIVREALTNARRYAFGAELVEVSVEHGRVTTQVTVADSGGSPADDDGRSRRRLGLVGMRERVEALGGTLESGPHERGWRIVARLPHAGSRRIPEGRHP